MKILYTFHSTKDAAKSVKVCEDNHLQVSIVAIPDHISSECGIAFNVDASEQEKVDALLKNIKIIPIKYEQE
ncbi:MAG: DUF3343 domain-containing protein [Rikenellaceae bacterium]